MRSTNTASTLHASAGSFPTAPDSALTPARSFALQAYWLPDLRSYSATYAVANALRQAVCSAVGSGSGSSGGDAA